MIIFLNIVAILHFYKGFWSDECKSIFLVTVLVTWLFLNNAAELTYEVPVSMKITELGLTYLFLSSVVVRIMSP
jgi:hypothetical protein